MTGCTVSFIYRLSYRLMLLDPDNLQVLLLQHVAPLSFISADVSVQHKCYVKLA